MPDEIDKPAGPFDIPSLEQDLRTQLHEAIEKSKDPPIEEDWTPEDRAELNSELARIPFNSSHSNPDFPDHTVMLEGEKARVHAYNNFPMILTLLDMLRHSAQKPPESSFEAAYAAVAGERKYFEIFDKLETTFPIVYKASKLSYGVRNQSEPKDLGLSAEQREFIHSQAYSAAAHIAQAIDSSYNLDFLRK